MWAECLCRRRCRPLSSSPLLSSNCFVIMLLFDSFVTSLLRTVRCGSVDAVRCGKTFKNATPTQHFHTEIIMYEYHPPAKASSFVEFICANFHINEKQWTEQVGDTNREQETANGGREMKWKNKNYYTTCHMKIHLRSNDWVIMCGTFILSTENKSFLICCFVLYAMWMKYDDGSRRGTSNGNRPNFLLCF